MPRVHLSILRRRPHCRALDGLQFARDAAYSTRLAPDRQGGALPRFHSRQPLLAAAALIAS